jgi:hypothetical protein
MAPGSPLHDVLKAAWKSPPDFIPFRKPLTRISAVFSLAELPM